MNIDKWDKRRLELLRKSKLTETEKRELKLLEKCVGTYVNSMNTEYKSNWDRILGKLRDLGINI